MTQKAPRIEPLCRWRDYPKIAEAFIVAVAELDRLGATDTLNRIEEIIGPCPDLPPP